MGSSYIIQERVITDEKKKFLVSMRWLSLLFLICSSCEKNAVENQQDVIALKVQARGAQLSLVDDITLEFPESGPGLGIVSSFAVLDDYIIVLDSLRKSIAVFDIQGNYKWSIGSRGDGEGQYKIPREPTIIPNTDQMLIYDAGTGQILRFSLKGEFVGRLKLPERRFINRMLVSDERYLIHTYVDENKNGMLCVTSLDTGKDLAKFKVSSTQYGNLFLSLGRTQGIAFDEAQKMIYFALPWEDKVMRIDLKAQRFLKPITMNQSKFISVKVDDSKNQKELAKNIDNFSRLSWMHLPSSGNILLRYLFNNSSRSTALILLSGLNVQPLAQDVKNELGVNAAFTYHGGAVYEYSPPTDNEDTNGRILIYRLINPPVDPPESPTG